MRGAGLVAVMAVVACPGALFAEEGERSAGIEGALVLPAFESPDSTSFALATWGLTGFGQFGLFDDLWLVARGSFSAFSAKTSESRAYLGRELVGKLTFDADQLHLEAGARYNLFGGYNLTPFLEGSVGFMWTVFRHEQLLDASGRSFGLTLADEAVSALTATVGLKLEFRLLNLIFLGVGARWTEVFGGGRTKRVISVPLGAAIYW